MPINTIIICSLVCFILGVLVGALVLFCAAVQYVHKFKKIARSTTPITHATIAVYEEVSSNTQKERKNDIEINENVAYGPVSNN